MDCNLELNLFGEPPPAVEPLGSDGLSLQRRFELFHEANPWVLEKLVKMTCDLKARGRKKVGIAQLFEVIRWNVAMTTRDPTSEWKLNNSYRSRYVRMISKLHPELGEMFELRRLKAK